MSKPWQKHRKGRITGSKMHSVFTLKESTSRTNIVKSILGMLPDFKTPSMKYGIDNEKKQLGGHTQNFRMNFTKMSNVNQRDLFLMKNILI